MNIAKFRKMLEDAGLSADKVSQKKDGTFEVKRSYFFSHGQTAEKFGFLVQEKIGLIHQVIATRNDYARHPKTSYFVAVVKANDLEPVKPRKPRAPKPGAPGIPTLTIAEFERRERSWSGVRGRREFDREPRVYVGLKSESILQNLVLRRSRPVDAWSTVMPEVIKRLGLPDTTKFKWSQKAGCSCGCSPAFILRTSGRFDVWVTVDGPAHSMEPEALALAASRLESVKRDPTLNLS